MSLSSKLCGVQKNTCGYNIAILVKSLNQHGANRYGSMLIQRFDLNRNIVATCIFFNTAILHKKFLRFDPTLGSNNLGLKNSRIKNHHIFGISRTSAFIWHTLDTSEKRRLRLHSFGPLWTISTGNQWEINALYSHREQLEVGNIFKINVFAHFWSKCDFFDWHFF